MPLVAEAFKNSSAFLRFSYYTEWMLIDGLLTTMYELLHNEIFVKLGFKKRTDINVQHSLQKL